MATTPLETLLRIAPANWTPDPRNLPKFGLSSVADFHAPGDATTNVDSSTFWGTSTGFFGATGALITSNWVANTYQTLVGPITGRGLVSFVLGPHTPTSGDVTTIRWTIDGVVTVVSLDNKTGNLTRCGQGLLTPINFADTNYSDVAAVCAGSTLSSGATDFTAINPLIADPATYLSVGAALGMGCPLVYFSQSLKIEMQISSALSTANLKNAGVQYLLLN